MNTPTPRNMRILSQRDSHFGGHALADDYYAFVSQAYGDVTQTASRFKRGLTTIGGLKKGVVGTARRNHPSGYWREYVVIHKSATDILELADVFLEVEDAKDRLAYEQARLDSLLFERIPS